MRARLNSEGFSLIELMISVSIIGIIAITAVPSFNKYMYRAKAVEAYSSMDAINKARTVHFLDYGRFVVFQTIDSLSPGKGKQQMTATTDKAWKKLGTPFPGDSYNYFGYSAYGGFTDNAGDPFETFWQGDPPVLGTYSFTRSGKVNSLFKSFGSDGSVTNCLFNWNDADLGINQNPGEHWALTFAVADFENEIEDTCTIYLQVINWAEGNFAKTPIIALNEGQ